MTVKLLGWNWSTLAAVVGVAVIVTVIAWFSMRTERWDSFAIATCAGLYRNASSAADTLRVDGQIPLQRSETNPTPLTCGALRTAYPDKVVPK